jgi:hypothetical protein
METDAWDALKLWKSIMTGGVYSLLVRRLSLGLLRAAAALSHRQPHRVEQSFIAISDPRCKPPNPRCNPLIPIVLLVSKDSASGNNCSLSLAICRRGSAALNDQRSPIPSRKELLDVTEVVLSSLAARWACLGRAP